jgi:hypothetical protein
MYVYLLFIFLYMFRAHMPIIRRCWKLRCSNKVLCLLYCVWWVLWGGHIPQLQPPHTTGFSTLSYGTTTLHAPPSRVSTTAIRPHSPYKSLTSQHSIRAAEFGTEEHNAHAISENKPVTTIVIDDIPTRQDMSFDWRNRALQEESWLQ